MEIQTVQTIKYRAPFDFKTVGWKGREAGRGSAKQGTKFSVFGNQRRTSKSPRDGHRSP